MKVRPAPTSKNCSRVTPMIGAPLAPTAPRDRQWLLTGGVLALVSKPGFDPNQFVGGISSSEWRKLNNDPAKPLLNRVIQARYPPASPFKLAIAAMAFRAGSSQHLRDFIDGAASGHHVIDEESGLEADGHPMSTQR